MISSPLIENLLAYHSSSAVKTYLINDGWTFLGRGFFANVFGKGDRVLKLTSMRPDWGYAEYLEYLESQPDDPIYPKIYGAAHTEHFSIVELERLERIDSDDHWAFLAYERLEGIVRQGEPESTLDAQHQGSLPAIRNFKKYVCGRGTDFHRGNVMVRKRTKEDYDLVITDPFAGYFGSPPIQQKIQRKQREFCCLCTACTRSRIRKGTQPDDTKPITTKPDESKPLLDQEKWHKRHPEMPDPLDLNWCMCDHCQKNRKEKLVSPVAAVKQSVGFGAQFDRLPVVRPDIWAFMVQGLLVIDSIKPKKTKKAWPVPRFGMHNIKIQANENEGHGRCRGKVPLFIREQYHRQRRTMQRVL